jgi:hypothetical protein
LQAVGDHVAELLTQAPQRRDPPAPAVAAGGDALARCAREIEAVLRAAVDAAQQIRARAGEEILELRAAAAEKLAHDRAEWEREREEVRAADEAARAEAQRQIDEAKEAATVALLEAEKRREEATREAKARRKHLEAQSQQMRDEQASTVEMHAVAMRELAAAQAIKQAAETDAAALLAGAAAEAETLRRQIHERLQQSIRDLGEIITMDPPVTGPAAATPDPPAETALPPGPSGDTSTA